MNKYSQPAALLFRQLLVSIYGRLVLSGVVGHGTAAISGWVRPSVAQVACAWVQYFGGPNLHIRFNHQRARAALEVRGYSANSIPARKCVSKYRSGGRLCVRYAPIVVRKDPVRRKQQFHNQCRLP